MSAAGGGGVHRSATVRGGATVGGGVSAARGPYCLNDVQGRGWGGGRMWCGVRYSDLIKLLINTWFSIRPLRCSVSQWSHLSSQSVP